MLQLSLLLASLLEFLLLLLLLLLQLLLSLLLLQLCLALPLLLLLLPLLLLPLSLLLLLLFFLFLFLLLFLSLVRILRLGRLTRRLDGSLGFSLSLHDGQGQYATQKGREVESTVLHNHLLMLMVGDSECISH